MRMWAFPVNSGDVVCRSPPVIKSVKTTTRKNSMAAGKGEKEEGRPYDGYPIAGSPVGDQLQ